MAKPIIINQFNGGMGKDPRNGNFAYCQYCKNFDIWSNENRLTPYRSSADANTGADTNALRAFLQGSQGGTYALGVTDTTDNFPKIFLEDDITGTVSWSAMGNGQGATHALRSQGTFFEYNGFLYGWNAQGLWRADITTSVAFANTWQAITTSLAQTDQAPHLWHSQDDVQYLAYPDGSGNWQIATISGTTFGSATALSGGIPKNLKVVRLVEYGDLIAIVCAPKVSRTAHSRVLFWDRNTSTTTFVANLPLGDVDVMTGGNIDGRLITVSMDEYSRDSATRIVFHSYAGGTPNIERIVQTNAALSVIKGGQVVGSKFFFAVQDTASSDRRWAGIWCIGRKDVGSPFSVAIARDPSYGTSGTQIADDINGFFLWKDILVASWDTHEVSVTDSAFGTIGSTYETQIINGGDVTQMKELRGVSVGTVYQPSAGTIVAKYKKDEETSFTQIYSDGTNDSLHHSAINIESSGAVIPEGKEFTLQVVSTGGSEVTAIKARIEVTGKDLYE